MSKPDLPRITGRLPPAMELCLGCGMHIFPGTEICPHCGANCVELTREREEAIALALDAIARIERALAASQASDAPEAAAETDSAKEPS